MKFILVEADGSETELPIDNDFHFYGNTKTGLYYYNGHEYVEISPGVVNKLTKRKEDEDNPETEAERKDRLSRIKKIKKALSSGDLYNQLETDKVFFGDDEGDTEPATRPVKSTSKQKLIIDSIQDFIETQIGWTESEGYGKDSPFALDPDVLKKVRKRAPQPKDIEIGVYFDRSGSWNNDYVNNFGNDIISMLREFETDEELEMRGIHVHSTVYYFAVHVWKDEVKALAEGNNSGEPIIQHMIETQPTNIIIMTDKHMQTPDDERWWPDRKASYMKSKYVAPGGVWGIFIGGTPTNLIKGTPGGDSEWHLYGEEGAQIFELNYGEK